MSRQDLIVIFLFEFFFCKAEAERGKEKEREERRGRRREEGREEEREEERRARELPSAGLLPKYHNSQVQARPKPGLPRRLQELSSLSHHCHPPVPALTGSWSQEPELGIHPSHSNAEHKHLNC